MHHEVPTYPYLTKEYCEFNLCKEKKFIHEKKKRKRICKDDGNWEVCLAPFLESKNTILTKNVKNVVFGFTRFYYFRETASSKHSKITF